MLHPKHNQIDYGQQLAPPDGYQLTQAVGTTYSLDLEALMLIPVALFFAGTLDNPPEALRYDMLEAITRSAEKLTIYYQQGQLKVPRKYHPLIAYWEKGIVPVRMGIPAASFHPKVWVIRYDAEGKKPLYRLIVTSRNTTFDHSWDVAFCSMGEAGDKPLKSASPVVRFVEYLHGVHAIPDAAAFLKDLACVDFKVPDGFDTLIFRPIGIPSTQLGAPTVHPMKDRYWDELLIMSPFLDTTTLRELEDCTVKRCYLLSSKDALDCISPDLLSAFEVRQFCQAVEDGEFVEDREDGYLEEPQPQRLHAKLFVGLTAGKTHWYLGSANCTNPAQGRNIEAMVELAADSNNALKPKRIFDALTKQAQGDCAPLFEEYHLELRQDLSAEQQSWERELRQLRYELAGLPMRGEVHPLADGGGMYSYWICVDASGLHLPKGFTISYVPLAEEQKRPAILKSGFINEHEGFGPYPEAKLSPFLKWTIEKEEHQCQFLLPLVIDLPASRLNKIFTSIINSRDKFMQYLSFLLTEDDAGLISQGEPGDKDSERGIASVLGIEGAPVFEKLMIACSRSPEKLDAVDKLIARIKKEQELGGEPIVSEAFESLWSVFKEYRNGRR